MKKEYAVQLEGFPLFHDCLPQDISEYTPLFNERHYQKGDYLFLEEEIISTIFFILSGKVLIQKKYSNKHEYTTNILRTYDMFPITGLLEGQNYEHTALVAEPTISLEIPSSQLEKILTSNIQVKINYIKHLQQEIGNLNKLINHHICQSL